MSDLSREENIELINFELENTISHFSALVDILASLIGFQDVRKMFDNMLVILNSYFNFEKAIFIRRDNEKAEYKVISSFGFEDNFEFKASIRKRTSLAWCINDINSSLVIQDIISDNRFDKDEFFDISETSSVFATCFGDDKRYGVFVFYFGLQEISILRNLLNRMEDLLTLISPHFFNRLETTQTTQKFIQATNSKNYFDNILKSMKELLFVADANGNIRTINQAVTETLQYKKQDIIGKEVSSIFPLEDKTAILDKKHSEVKLRIKDDEEIFLALSTSKMFDSNSTFQGTVIIARDITGEKKAEKEKIDMQNKMFQTSKLASIGTLAAGVAHEINNPLTILIGYIEMLQSMLDRDDIEPEVFKDRLTTLLDSSFRIREIINGLKLYARADVDKNEILDINEIVEITTRPIKNIYLKDKVEIEVSFASKFLKITGNRGKLQQIVMNLVSNSFDAFDGHSGKIKINTFKKGKNAIIEVSDNGCGIPPNALEVIFDAFYTTKPPGKGTGLGLSICFSIIEEMGGAIDVSSKVGEGTKFTIKFPIAVGKIIDKNNADEVKNIKLIKNYGPNEKKIIGDKNMLEQVFINLLINAKDALKKTEEKVIEISTNFNDKTAIIYIEDSGAGIKEDIRDKIFNSFFTTKDVGDGTGLGLSIVHEIIKDHRGEINLVPTQKGTKFEIKIPLSLI